MGHVKDPCAKLSALGLECAAKNGHLSHRQKMTECNDVFAAYRECRKAAAKKVIADRIARGGSWSGV